MEYLLHLGFCLQLLQDSLYFLLVVLVHFELLQLLLLHEYPYFLYLEFHILHLWDSIILGSFCFCTSFAFLFISSLASSICSSNNIISSLGFLFLVNLTSFAFFTSCACFFAFFFGGGLNDDLKFGIWLAGYRASFA